jgi:Ca2+-transporting ATPase
LSIKAMSDQGGDFQPWAVECDEVLEKFDVDADTGLSDAQVAAQREKYGLNELAKEEGKPLWKLVLEQFDDLMVKILLAAAAVSFVLILLDEKAEGGIVDYVEPLVILLILILNAIVGVWQESNAESALEALKQMQSEHAATWRNGKLIPDLAATELVPGDIVEVRVGDKVPADMRVLKLYTTTFRVEQAALTGESVSVQKDSTPVEEDADISGKKCMAFSSTAVSNGHMKGIVVSTGMSTEIGQIQSAVQEAAEEEEDTPLKKKIDEFGELLSKVIAVICLVVWVINYNNFNDPAFGGWVGGCMYYLKIAVALAVAAIPEGLPAVITTCLALGTRKMAAKNAIVRKLPSVETLGCTTVICSDKTGTLTTNMMSVIRMALPGDSGMSDGGLAYTITGTSFDPAGGSVQGLEEYNASIQRVVDVCAMCNDARIAQKDGQFVCSGMPTEAALRVLVEKLGLPDRAAQADIQAQRAADPAAAAMAANSAIEQGFKKVATLEFSRDRKSMSVICSLPRNQAASGGARTRSQRKALASNVLLVKGATESVLDRCSSMLLPSGEVVPFGRREMAGAMQQADDMAGQALRVLALAVKTDLGDLQDYDGEHHPAHAQLQDPDDFAAIESQLTFVGLVGMQDPPRPEVRSSIETCRHAGIRVIVITGDNKATAEAIAQEIAVFQEGESLEGKSFTGREFMALPRAQQLAVLAGSGGRVFSRAEPKTKQEIVRLLKSQGEVVAMTGDGVNDAPALKLADIGIAMGIAGTEVAKEASDMVLADDNFSTIVSAVEEGRSIYNNMKAFIRYLISSNIGEVASIFFIAALGLPEALIPVQLLWVNLVTDGPPATALGFNPADADIMDKPPRKSDDVLINGWVFFRYMVVGLYVGFATVGVFVYWYLYYTASGDGHTLLTWDQITHFKSCSTWTDFHPVDFAGVSLAGDKACDYFTKGKVIPCTLSLSVLVTIEMLNAMNALSEDGSLVTMPPWRNPWLLLAMVISFGMHFVILYVPFLAEIFSIAPLDWNQWMLVLVFSFPVILIDEVLKLVGRAMSKKEQEERLKQD